MSIKIQPVTGALGAEIAGVDLSEALEELARDEIREALLCHGVIFFRDQKLSRPAQIRFASCFGTPDIHPIANGMEDFPEVIRVLKPAGEPAFFGTSWHSDNSFFAKPSAITVLYGEDLPPYGGDTLFASMEKAFETLSEPLKTFLSTLEAVHSAARAFDPDITGNAKYEGNAPITYTYSDRVHDSHVHPVVRTHPETGRKSLYINPMFTESIVGLNPNESAALLEMLYEHSTRPEFTCRLRWQRGSVAVWDNRCLQHYAVDDYADFERVMYRVTLSGERPR